MMNQQTIENNVLQGIAGYVQYLNEMRMAELAENLGKILTMESYKLKELAVRQANALEHLDWAQGNINHVIDINRGGGKGVHGFIAEFAEAGIVNAKRALQGLKKSTVVLNDNGVADLLRQGKPIQVKFYNNILSELKAAAKYPDMHMMFSKDHVEVYRQIMNGAKTVEFNGNRLTLNQIEKIRELINEESTRRGVSWTKWMKASVVSYDEVQKGAINQTISGEVDEINRQANIQKQEIKNQAENERNIAHQQSNPSLGEANKVAGIGAAVQGGLDLGIFIYKHHKEGKEIWEFEQQDWIDAGITTLKGAVKGGITGYAIYGLTNVCNLSAPSAGAIVSGTLGLAEAIIKHRTGEIDDDGFMSLITINAIDSAGAAIGAAIGQSIIPIPVVGPLIGSIVATTAISLGKDMLNKHQMQLISNYQNRVKNFIETLDAVHQSELKELLSKYAKLGELQTYAFDFDINVQLRFVSSIDLAQFVGVEESKILHNEAEIDNFFLE